MQNFERCIFHVLPSVVQCYALTRNKRGSKVKKYAEEWTSIEAICILDKNTVREHIL